MSSPGYLQFQPNNYRVHSRFLCFNICDSLCQQWETCSHYPQWVTYLIYCLHVTSLLFHFCPLSHGGMSSHSAWTLTLHTWLPFHRDTLLIPLGLCHPEPGCPLQEHCPHPAQALTPHPEQPSCVGTLLTQLGPRQLALTVKTLLLGALAHPLVLGANRWEREGKRKKSPSDLYLGRRKGSKTLIGTRVGTVECCGDGRWGVRWSTQQRTWALKTCSFLELAPVLGPVCVFEESTRIFLGWESCHQPGASSNHFLLKTTLWLLCFLCWLRTLTWLKEQEGWLLLCLLKQKRLLIKLSGSLCLRYFKKWNLEISLWTEFELHSKFIEQKCFRSF